MHASIPGKYGFRRRSEQRQVALELVWRLTEDLVKAELAQSAASSPSRVDELDWKSVPPGLDPADGDLDDDRAKRKRDQIASLAGYCLASAAMDTKAATVVEFGAGSGHLGILLAYLRPDANVVLVECQSHGCGRARRRVEALGISNCEVFEGTVDAFANTGRPFDLAVGLHTCGLLADAVLNLAVSRGAAYCVCPCCYGQVAMLNNEHDRGQGTSVRMHPCSRVFRSALTAEPAAETEVGDSSSSRSAPTAASGGYASAVALADEGTADRPVSTGAMAATSKPAARGESFVAGVCGEAWQGGAFDTAGHGFRTALRCMQTVDADRVAWARERGYSGALAVLEPLGCSPKCSVVRLEPPLQRART
eukprot:TRINITY_DN10780_c0_g1_i2.p1 TRINITY_DN10780_c0_g1~~TRINITY_DN10780_c0_g1_i2.p1  ORF type:complete len:365 (+),score=51.62 TRINITY_DN10780_c0_g1_i2:107-1201(+)